MLFNVKYVIYKDYGYTLNYELLYDLYSPIVGSEAINLYINLYHESNKQVKIAGVSSYLKDFNDACGHSPIKFSELRSKLEAIGLLQTYLQENINQTEMIYHFLIKQPLSFDNFINNQKYRYLLIKSIGQLNYEKLEYMYMPSRIPSDSTNVSSTFEMIFDNKELSEVKTFNFDKLYQNIAKNTSTLIVISNECKAIIESYYQNYNLSESEIEHIIYGCIVSTENTFEVDQDLLSLKFHEYINSAKNVSVFSNINLHRNAAMFVKNLSSEQIQTIFNEYKNLNSEQYLSAIYKTPLSSDEKETIEVLRNSYKLSDYVINLLVDFTIFKTNGKLNRTYICKIAKTVNGLNLNTLTDIYNFFRFKNKDINELNAKSSSELFKQEAIDWESI